MPSWFFWWIVLCACFVVSPAFLLLYAWVRNRTGMAVSIVPVAALIVLALALIPETKTALVGADYSHRLILTIEVFIGLTCVSVIYTASRRLWLIAIATALVAVGWIYMAAVNSVV